MATNNDVTVMNASFKHVYANAIEKLYPSNIIVAKKMQFAEGNTNGQIGRQFNQPVQLTREQGFQLNSDGSAYALATPVASVLAEAQITGISCTTRGRVSYSAAAQALKAQTKGARDKAFVNAAGYVIESMVDAAMYVQELELIYGGGPAPVGASAIGLGLFSSRTSGSGTGTQVFVITDATWAAGIWAGTEGMAMDSYSSANAKLNATGAITVAAVDLDLKSITFTGAAADLDAIAGGASPRFIFRGSYQAEMAGLYLQASNTGTLFNISAATYSLWKPSSYSAGSGQLTFSKALKAVTKPVERGLMDDFTYLVSIGAWTDMMNNLVVLRRYAENAGGKLEQGANELVFYGLNGKITFLPHPCIMGGHAIGVNWKKTRKIGATDLVFSQAVNQGQNENYFTELTDNAGWEMRNFWLLAGFCRAPATSLNLITNIVNAT